MAKKHNWQKRGKSATLHVCIGTDENGKPKRYTKTVPYTTDAKVDREWEKFYQECADGKHSRLKRLTINEMVALVMDERVSKTAKRTTIREYVTCQNKISTTIGTRIAKDTKPLHIQKWINELSAEVAPKTVINIYSFLRMCFDTAVGWELIASSPCHHIKLPRNQKKEVQILTAEELPTFLAALDKMPESKYDIKVAILMALFGGMRRGEICGLEETDVDLETGKVEIIKTLNVDIGSIYEDDPKSKTSVRSVYFPQEIISEFRHLILLHKEQQLQLGSKWKGSTKLIKGYMGADMYPGNLWKYFNMFQKENGLRHISFHALRHTHTSMLADMGKSLTEISKQLGHAQQSTTLNIYTHLFKDPDKSKKDTAAELSSLYLRK